MAPGSALLLIGLRQDPSSSASTHGGPSTALSSHQLPRTRGFVQPLGRAPANLPARLLVGAKQRSPKIPTCFAICAIWEASSPGTGMRRDLVHSGECPPREKSRGGIAVSTIRRQYHPIPHHNKSIDSNLQGKVHRASQSQLSLHLSLASACLIYPQLRLQGMRRNGIANPWLESMALRRPSSIPTPLAIFPTPSSGGLRAALSSTGPAWSATSRDCDFNAPTRKPGFL